MGPSKMQLFRLIQQGKSLENKALLDGFGAFQDWKAEMCELFQALQAEFEVEIQTPLDIAKAIRFVEKTFQTD
jgi:hypothetical protein